MNTTVSTTTRPARDVAARAVLVVAVSCFSVHVVLLVATGTTMMAMALSMLALSGVCVACTWRAGTHTVRDHLIAAGTGLAMIVAHLLLMPAGADPMTDGTHHAGMDHAEMAMTSTGSLLPDGAVDGLMQIGIALAVVQLVLAVGAVVRLSSRSVA